MAAPKMGELIELERKFGVTAGDLSYQARCSRVAAFEKGEPWEPPKAERVKRGTMDNNPQVPTMSRIEDHPLYGKTLLITPLMTLDKDRALYYEERLGSEVIVEEVNAGALLYGANEDVDRISGDYKIIRTDPNKIVTAKTSIPKAGQEITFTIGRDLVPVVRGNDGNKGYIWAMTSHVRQFEDTLIQMHGLKTLITAQWPELLPKFAGKPVMTYIDGFALAASIPLTEAIIKEHRRKELQNAKLGLD